MRGLVFWICAVVTVAIAHATTAPSLDDKVTIIGAGPGGIHMAMLLKERGYTDVTILEKSQRIGGKSWTYWYKGTPFELGTCYMHPRYDAIRDLLRKYNASRPGLADESWNDPSYVVYTSDLRVAPDRHVPMEKKEWMLSAIEKDVLPFSLWGLPRSISKVFIWRHANRYMQKHREIFGEGFNQYQFPPRLSEEQLDQYGLRLPAEQWLMKNNMLALKSLLKFGLSAQGYGLLETMPAYYMLWWISADMLQGVLEALQDKSGTKPPVKATLRNGFQALWETIAQAEDLKIRFGFGVTRIDRSGPSIRIFGPQHQELTTDWLILAVPIQENLNMLDATDDELVLFESQTSFAIKSTLWENNPVGGACELWRNALNYGVQFWPDRMVPEEAGQVYALRCPPKELARNAAAYAAASHDVQVAYQFADTALANQFDNDTMRHLFKSWASWEGLDHVSIIAEFWTRYFYHWRPNDVGNAWRLFDLQGHKRTWYIGSSASFESVLNVVNYNRMLLDTISP